MITKIPPTRLSGGNAFLFVISRVLSFCRPILFPRMEQALSNRSLLWLIITVPQSDNAQIRFQALHHIFLAAARVIQAGKAINPNFRFGSMICHITMYPLTCNPDDVLLSQQEDLIRNCFCGDVQLMGEYPYYMLNYFDQKGITLDITEEDRALLRTYPHDFYAFSYYMSKGGGQP